MKKPKKTVAFPRRQWQINPVTRVEKSTKSYSRRQNRREEQRAKNEE